MVDCEYLKLFIRNCKNDYKLNSRRSLWFCNKTMSAFFYLLTYQIELDDYVFFTSVELLNKYLINSMIKTCHSIRKDSNQLNIYKEKYLKEKYLIAIACFQLATQICDQSIDSSRLTEYFHELTRYDQNLFSIPKITRDQLIEMEIEILTTIDYRFPQSIPHMFISYFIRYLNDEMKLTSDRLHNASMLLLVHIYLQWNSLIEILAKKESGSTTINQIQMENVIQRFRDPLLVASSTILAASKMFCHGINPQIHDKIISLFVSLLGIDPMRIYMAQFFADEVLQKSVHGQFLTGQMNDSNSRILIDREHDFDDESMVNFSSP